MAGSRLHRSAVVAATVAVALLASAGSATAQVRLTREEALELAFPGPARIERHTAYLDAAQLDRIEQRVDGADGNAVVTYYVGRSEAGAIGVAYFDVHRVRTMPEVLMIVIDPAGRVDRVEILRFAEPHEYMAPAGWLARFDGRSLAGDLEQGDAVIGITGATLTSRAVTGAVRRTLALHELFDPLAATEAAAGAPEAP